MAMIVGPKTAQQGGNYSHEFGIEVTFLFHGAEEFREVFCDSERCANKHTFGSKPDALNSIYVKLRLFPIFVGT